MAIRTYKPTSPARRFMSVLTYEEITKKSPEKSLVEYLKKNAGRNKQGKITVRHQGGGNKIKYRVSWKFRRRLPRLSTTRTAARSSPCCSTPTARSVTSWLLWA